MKVGIALLGSLPAAVVGAMGAMDRHGRPAVSCPQTPMDLACH